MKKPKQKLGKIIRDAGEIFNVSSAAKVLDVPNTEAAKILARWTKQGWLTRIQRGLYAVVPIEASTTNQALEDAWILAPELFAPCYIGGWSAAEHWDYTEQIFRDICVITERVVATKKKEVHGIKFIVTRIKNALDFGTKTLWRQDKKILISDPHKTIIDMMVNPELGGGIQHTMECFSAYLESTHFDPDKLADYAEKLSNGAVYKRLGYLCERKLGDTHLLTKICKSNLSKGNAYLDPNIKNGALISRWRLFVPVNIRDSNK
ncbi:MAG: hypothetical protein O3A01_00035 [bacterium]|nr:hypothetical protein [bacterium]